MDIDIDINIPLPEIPPLSRRISALYENATQLYLIGQFRPANALIRQANILTGNQFEEHEDTPPPSPYQSPRRYINVLSDSSDDEDYGPDAETKDEEYQLPNWEWV